MHRSVMAIGGVLLCAASLFAAYWWQTKAKFSTWAEHQADQRSRDIQAEIKKLGKHPWAGEYYKGDGLGENVSLILAPKAGYVFEWHGCLGVYDRNFGRVTFAKNAVHLSFTFANKRHGFQGIASEFVPISWGPRKYLVPPNEIIDFCNSVNAGDEPRSDMHGFHLLCRGDEKKQTKGFPAVPAEFEKYLQKKPITAEIVAVGVPKLRPSVADWKFKDTPVTIQGGKNVGLRRGMELHVTSPNDVVESVRITEVNESTSEGVMTQIGQESVGPKVGWKLSSRPSWNSDARRKGQTKEPKAQ